MYPRRAWWWVPVVLMIVAAVLFWADVAGLIGGEHVVAAGWGCLVVALLVERVPAP